MACEHILLHVPQSVLVDKPSSEYLDSGAVSSSLRMARQSRNVVVFPYNTLVLRLARKGLKTNIYVVGTAVLAAQEKIYDSGEAHWEAAALGPAVWSSSDSGSGICGVTGRDRRFLDGALVAKAGVLRAQSPRR